MRIIDVTKEDLRIARPGAVPDALLSGADAWLALQESNLDSLISDRCPSLLALGFSVRGLNTAVDWLLESVLDQKSAVQGGGGDMLALVARYWGEYLTRNFEGEWVLTFADDRAPTNRPRILLPYGRPLYEVFGDVLSCVATRENRLTAIAGYAKKLYEAWESNERPALSLQSA